jgi:chemotaxis protein MotB
MRYNQWILVLFVVLFSSSCVTKKQFMTVESKLSATEKELEVANKDLARYERTIKEYESKIADCNAQNTKFKNDLDKSKTTADFREEQIKDLRAQIDDIKIQRDKQLEQVGDLTVLSQSASNNIKETLSQLERKDKYVTFLQTARTKADSINLALAVNLKSVLKDGLADEDIDIKVDKTVVFINLSDKMLFTSGSSSLTPKAKEVLGKIAKIIESRPNLEVMVEGHTDNVPINKACTKDNWDLSVQRASEVVKVLQTQYNVPPSKLIAAGRSEYVPLAPNDSYENRAMNRRTRIIILPKLDEFYELLNPTNIPD